MVKSKTVIMSFSGDGAKVEYDVELTGPGTVTIREFHSGTEHCTSILGIPLEALEEAVQELRKESKV